MTDQLIHHTKFLTWISTANIEGGKEQKQRENQKKNKTKNNKNNNINNEAYHETCHSKIFIEGDNKQV